MCEDKENSPQRRCSKEKKKVTTGAGVSRNAVSKKVKVTLNDPACGLAKKNDWKIQQSTEIVSELINFEMCPKIIVSELITFEMCPKILPSLGALEKTRRGF